MSSVRKNIKSGVIWSGVLAGSRIGLQFLSTIILAHLLSPDDYGLMGMLAVFIAVSETLMDAGMGGALIRKKDASPTDFGTLTSYNMIVSVILYLTIFLLAPWIAEFYDRPILVNMMRIYGSVLIIEAVAIVPRVMLMRTLQFRKYAMIGLIAGAVGLIVAVVSALLGWGVYSLLWQLLLSSLISSAMMIVCSHYRLSFCFSMQSFKSLFGFGFNTTLGNLIKNFAENIFTNVVGKVAPLHLTGYYNQGFKLQNIVASVQTTIIDNALFSVLSKEPNDRIVDISIRINYLAAYIVVYLYAILIFNAHLIVSLMLGEQWLGMIPYFKLLLIGGVFQSFTAFNRNIFKTLAETFSIVSCELFSLVSILFLFISMKSGVIAIIYTFIGYAICRWQVSLLLLNKKKHIKYVNYMRKLLVCIMPMVIAIAILSSIQFCENPIMDGLILSFVLTIVILVSGRLTQNEEFLELKSLLMSVFNKFKN